MSRSNSPDRRSQAIKAERQADREERQQIRQYRADLQTILDGWDAATNATRFGWTKDLVRIVRRTLRFF
jgi:hypothetical protein